MRDVALLAALILAFAVAVTAHVLIVAGLVARGRAGRAALAVLLPPLAPPFAVRERMRARAVVWVLAALAYVVATALGRDA